MTQLTNLFATAIQDTQTTFHGAFYIAMCAVLGIVAGYCVLVALKSMLSTIRGYYTRGVERVQKQMAEAKSDMSSRPFAH